MAMAVTTGFDPDKHLLDGIGWVNSWDAGGDETQTAYFANLAAAQAAAQDLFSLDTTIHNTLVQQGNTAYIVANQSAVNTQITALRTGESLDAAFPPP